MGPCLCFRAPSTQLEADGPSASCSFECVADLLLLTQPRIPVPVDPRLPDGLGLSLAVRPSHALLRSPLLELFPFRWSFDPAACSLPFPVALSTRIGRGVQGGLGGPGVSRKGPGCCGGPAEKTAKNQKNAPIFELQGGLKQVRGV